MTPAQIKNIHIAKSQLHLSDSQYRLLLRNAADVYSSKQLTNESYEDVMAILEDMGYRQLERESPDSLPQPAAPNYWRLKVAQRGTQANFRLIHKIMQLHNAQLPFTNYQLPGLVKRTTEGRTEDVRCLTPREALNLIESLKAILARNQGHEETRERGTEPSSSSPSFPQSLVSPFPSSEAPS